ncbi:glycosyltransferase family 2 protein [Fibrella forsythiae]|uniref:Glycosyltransferase family 2 protein n=1 Tax=Fibrella forsythiae TaxID=2817061 RepID=A0ABS3JJ73_9BACT|nr:glycosyltransferase family A protein [Fibrella forsythiae]MBO0950058.1 glycosyltransferase family 2 protein [Fibrella forsythiae]
MGVEEELSKPVVSIVIPLYNQQLTYFQEALASALAQTYDSVEILVSDNHSTNETPAWLATQTDTRLRVVRPDRFLPMVEHFQFAADQARGGWILYLCSDDYLYPTCVETLVANLPADNSAVVAYGELASVDFRDLNQIKFYYNRKPTALRTPAESLNELVRARPFFAWIPGGMIRRDTYLHCRDVLDGHITYGFDVALLLKAHEAGNVLYVDEPVGKFRIWTAKDGKLGGNRLIKNIVDAGQYLGLVQDSPILRSYLIPETMAEWRSYQARRWELAALIDFFTGGCTPEEANRALTIVSEKVHPPSTFTKLVAFLLGSPQANLTKPALNGIYTLFLQIQKLVKRPF